jgi:hypothetical protein
MEAKGRNLESEELRGFWLVSKQGIVLMLDAG